MTYTDEELLEVIKEHALAHPSFLEKFDKSSLKKEINATIRSRKKLELVELALYRSQYTVREYRAKMKKICDGDMTLFHKEYDDTDWFNGFRED